MAMDVSFMHEEDESCQLSAKSQLLEILDEAMSGLAYLKATLRYKCNGFLSCQLRLKLKPPWVLTMNYKITFDHVAVGCANCVF